jgi:hypothetical protein
LHGRPVEVRGTLKNRALVPKGASAYDNLIVEVEDKTEAEMNDIMARWYSVCHSIGSFPPGEEPFPGTYDCRFCSKELSTVHHDYEHTRACAKEHALVQAQALLDSVSPLDQPCQYQTCGNKERLGQFVVCGATFDTAAKRGEHVRQHVRSMTKKDNNGEKVSTCFYGSCATNPEGGRLRRNGPDFLDDKERLAHMWSHHQVTPSKVTSVSFCEYCSTWLLAPNEWASAHAVLHADDA